MFNNPLNPSKLLDPASICMNMKMIFKYLHEYEYDF